MYTININKQTLNERFEDYNEPTEQEEIWSDEIIGEEELQEKTFQRKVTRLNDVPGSFPVVR